MANGIIYDATWDTSTKTLGFYDKAGNLIYSCVVNTQPQPLPVIVDDPTQPLYLRSTQDGSTVYLQGSSSYVNDTTFEKSTDGTTWSDFALTSTNAVTLNRGDGVYIRAKVARTTFPTESNIIPICIRMTGTIEAYHNCYSMLTPSFSGLTDLTTIGAHCLQALFTPNTVSSSATARNTALVKAPLLPATTLSPYCYIHLYHYCTALTQTSALPAINLAEGCYSQMHKYCQSLTTAPTLPATTLAPSCYYAMFDNTALTVAPNLPADVLATYCYAYMFNGVSTLNEVHIAATNISASNCMSNWVKGVSETGNFYCVEGVAYPTGINGCPSGWSKHTTFVESPNLPLCFKATQDSSSVTLYQRNGITEVYEYSVDGLTWTTWSFDTQIPLDKGDKIFVRTQSTSRSQQQNNITYICFRMTGQIEAYNNVNSLLKKTAFASITDLSQVANSECAFTELFYNPWMSDSFSNTSLVKAPLFPATTLSAFCYSETFRKCDALVQGPELPATNLANYCYYNLYYNAASLSEVHISATNVSTTGCIRDWLTGASATGDFYCINGVSYPTGTSGIPSGWTRHDLT